MVNVERTGKRSLAFNNWHRAAFPDDCAANDLDLVGRCPELACRASLYLIEDTQTTRDLDQAGEAKQTWWSEMTAHEMKVPVILIVYSAQDESLVELRAWRCILAPRRNTECSERTLIGDGDDLIAYLKLIRRAHAAVFHAALKKPPNTIPSPAAP